jgi:hypothetical protein
MLVTPRAVFRCGQIIERAMQPYSLIFHAASALVCSSDLIVTFGAGDAR